MVSSIGLKARTDSSKPHLIKATEEAVAKESTLVAVKETSVGRQVLVFAGHAEHQQEAFSCHVLANRKLSAMDVIKTERLS